MNSHDRHLAYEGVDCHDGGNQVLASPAIERLPTTKFQPEPEIPPIYGGGVGTKLRRTARARWSDYEAARWLGLRWVPLSPPSHFPGMEPGLLRVAVRQLQTTAIQWSQQAVELAAASLTRGAASTRRGGGQGRERLARSTGVSAFGTQVRPAVTTCPTTSASTLDELPIAPTRSRYAVFLTDSSTH